MLATIVIEKAGNGLRALARAMHLTRHPAHKLGHPRR
jgi:hypothetical protein